MFTQQSAVCACTRRGATLQKTHRERQRLGSLPGTTGISINILQRCPRYRAGIGGGGGQDGTGGEGVDGGNMSAIVWFCLRVGFQGWGLGGYGAQGAPVGETSSDV